MSSSSRQGLRHTPPRLPDIDPARCTGCGRCVAVCGPHVLSLHTVQWQKFATLHEPAACTGCSLCAVACPFRAITMHLPKPGIAPIPFVTPLDKLPR